MAAKRKREEGLEVLQIEAPCEKVTVHGLVTSLSPIKASKKNDSVKYFNANLTNGKKSIRVVSFSPNIHTQMEKFQMEATPVALSDCQVKEVSSQFSKSGENFEIVASNHSTVEISPEKKFDLPSDFTKRGTCLSYITTRAEQHIS